MGIIASFFRRKDPDTPVKGCGARIKNLIKNNFRGLVGFLVPLAALTWQGEKFNHPKTVECMWIWMLWTYIWQPVSLPVCALIPNFVLPMAGVMNTKKLCSMLFNDTVVLFLLGSMINLLFCNSGLDRRIMLSSLCAGPYTQSKLVFKASTTAFFLSIFCNKLIVASTIITLVAPTLLSLQGPTKDVDYKKFRYIFCIAVHTAAIIGGNVFPHGSFTILCMRSLFYNSPKNMYDYPDIFNCLHYLMYSFPVSLIMHAVTSVYYKILVDKRSKPALPAAVMTKIDNALKEHKKKIPKGLTLHEKESAFFMFVFLILCITRWSKFLNMGWSTFTKEELAPEIPRIRDAVVAAFLIVLLFSLPKGYGFLKYFTASKKKDMPPAKPESSILFWRFVDKNVIYGYSFVIGSANVISSACSTDFKEWGSLANTITNNSGKLLTDMPFNASIGIICLISGLLSQIMPDVAACSIWCPFVINMARVGAPNNWDTKLYLGTLAVGMSTSLGFMSPFQNTTPSFSKAIGKTPLLAMIKYALFPFIVCNLIVWASVCFFAPLLWDPEDQGFVAIQGLDFATTTEADAAPAP